jgi:hypothetical protein
MQGMTHSLEDWTATAVRLGYDIENGGDHKLIAHVDGVEHGCWDPNYGGCGHGWFYKVHAGDLNAGVVNHFDQDARGFNPK